MQLISKFIKGFHFLLWVIDINSKYTWVVSLKDNKGITINNTFQENQIQIYSIHFVMKKTLLLLKDLLEP